MLAVKQGRGGGGGNMAVGAPVQGATPNSVLYADANRDLANGDLWWDGLHLGLATGGVDPTAHLVVGRAYPNNTGLVRITHGNTSYGSSGLDLYNGNSGAHVVLQTVPGGNVLLTDLAGTAAGVSIGRIANPADGSSLSIVYGNWYITGGSAGNHFGVNATPGATTQMVVAASSDTTVGLAVQRKSPTATADIFQAQDALGNALLGIAPGGSVTFGRLSSTATGRAVAYLDAGFTDNTDATYKGFVRLCAQDFAGTAGGREGLRVESDGTTALVTVTAGELHVGPGTTLAHGVVHFQASDDGNHGFVSVSKSTGTRTIFAQGGDSNGYLMNASGGFVFQTQSQPYNFPPDGASVFNGYALAGRNGMFRIVDSNWGFAGWNSGGTYLTQCVHAASESGGNQSGWRVYDAPQNRTSLFVDRNGYVAVNYWDTPAGQFHVVNSSASLNAIVVDAAASQTAPLVALRGLSSTSTPRPFGYLGGGFATATDATFKGYVRLAAQDFANTAGGREGLRVGTDGTQPLVAFFGGTPQAKPTITGSRAGNAALASLLTQLAALGLIIDSTTA